MMRLRGWLVLAWVLPSWACVPNAATCGASSCSVDEACVDGTCRLRCNTTQDCLQSQRCSDGTCVAGSAGGADAGRPPTDGGPGDAGPLPDGAGGASSSASATASGASSLAATSWTGAASSAVSGVSSAASSSAGGSASGASASPSSQGTVTSGTSSSGGSTGTLDAGTTDAATRTADGGCVPGRVERFPDPDTDGVGVEPGQCVPGDAGGYAAVPGDCAPNDPLAWRLAAVDLDQDNDGVGVPQGMRCVGTVTAPYSETARPAAVVMGNPMVTASSLGGRNWSLPNNASQATGLAATCNNIRQGCVPLDCQTFDRWGAAVAPYRGAEVFVRARVSAATSAELQVSVGMALSTQGPFVTRAGSWPITTQYAWYAVGSRDDAWDDIINATFPGAQQTPLIRAGFVGPDMGIGVSLLVDAIRVRFWPVEGPPDCNDMDPGVSIPAVGWLDQDVDSYGINNGNGCWPVDMGNYTHRGTDCDDTTADVRPGNTQYFTSATDAGSFDYDCSSNVTKNTFTPSTCVAVDGGVDGGACTAAAGGTVSPAAACGQPFSYSICNTSTCTLTTRNAVVSCR